MSDLHVLSYLDNLRSRKDEVRKLSNLHKKLNSRKYEVLKVLEQEVDDENTKTALLQLVEAETRLLRQVQEKADQFYLYAAKAVESLPVIDEPAEHLINNKVVETIALLRDYRNHLHTRNSRLQFERVVASNPTTQGIIDIEKLLAEENKTVDDLLQRSVHLQGDVQKLAQREKYKAMIGTASIMALVAGEVADNDLLRIAGVLGLVIVILGLIIPLLESFDQESR